MLSCPFIGREFDDNWGLEDPTGKSNEEYRRIIKENSDPHKDLLTGSSAALMLSDTEMKDFLAAYAKLIQQYINHKPADGKKVRKITFVVSPNE